MADAYDLHDLLDLEILEQFERRERFIPDHRNNDLDELDNIDFRKRYRFDKKTVEEIVAMLHDRLKSSTEKNRAITPTEKVLAALKFFAFGSQQINVGDMHGLSQPSASNIINEVAKQLAELSSQYIYLPQTEAERMEISQNFYTQFNFPSVYGALDCTLIKILSPGGPLAESFRCRKGFFALNVQTMSDTNLMIRNIVARWPGSAHDSTIFDHSHLRAHLEVEVPNNYHVLGDGGYPLRQYLLTPFLNPINADQMRYNAAHIAARNVVERQYGVWKSRFSCLLNPLRCHLSNAQRIIIATAVLHNIAITLGDYYEEDTHDSDTNDNPTSQGQSVGGVTKRNFIVSNFFS